MLSSSRRIVLALEEGYLSSGLLALKISAVLPAMTKLLEWVFGVLVVGAAWALVTFDLLDLRLPEAFRQVAWPMPVYLLVVFGCYSLATVGYRVATFNDCEEASKELQAQIQEAKEDLRRKGLKL
ncbi:hypothetical protein DPEC_G00203870 [Dallia pectoralis]|uniref:Uncharacterized protein n=1 Tax=Dallia pectoralis TaxID=75939 RepID=A0ACC2G9N9_DALPE|nr:hypothetical protein DPEC_G00203870 [Dallia pectoralis]